MACPLCDHDRSRPSWVGAIAYDGSRFPYVQCLGCGSSYSDPMPDDETLRTLYGSRYGASFAAVQPTNEARDSERVIKLLASLNRGTFIDYGCGGGSLLREAARLKWKAIGIEFDGDVAASVENETDAKVLAAARIGTLNGERADLLHLGDVLEHLTKMNAQMPDILRLIKPGGLLVACGPLEANPNLFTLSVRAARVLRRKRITEMPPYHVMLATVRGQRTLFRRFGLTELTYEVREVAWPAPDRILLSDMRRPRSLGLFALRRFSQAVTALVPATMGNRYFYVGRWNG